MIDATRMSHDSHSRSSLEHHTLVDLLRWRALNQENKIAFRYLADGDQEEMSLTYAELDSKARAIAAFLQSLKAKGERVLLLFPQGLDYISAFFGCLYANAVAVPIYPPRFNRSLRRLEAVAADAEATIALTNTQIASKAQPFIAQNSGLNAMNWITADTLTGDLANQWQNSDINGSTLAFLQYTSGSTQTPRGVMVSHANLLHNEKMIEQAFGQTQDSIIVSWLPLYHDMGLIGGVLQPVYLGATCVLMSPVAFLQRPFRWLHAISRYSATTSGGPNSAYDICARKITPEQRASLDLSSWSVAFNGSEPVRAETLDNFARAFESCGFRKEAFYPCYGLAEATLFVSGGAVSSLPVVKTVRAREIEMNRVVDAQGDTENIRPLVACGTTFLDQAIVIANPETHACCPPDEVGEIWIAGSGVAQGYWNRPTETEKIFNAFLSDTGEGPFLRTGDLGFISNGELFITGRLKDLIIIRGRNLYAQDVELTAERSHPALRPGQGAAFSIEVAGDEQMVIAQELDPHYQSRTDAVIQAICNAVSEEHEVRPFAIVLIAPGSLPKTSSGKVQRHACKADFLQGNLKVMAGWRDELATEAGLAAAAAPASHSRQDIESWLISQLATKLRIPSSEVDVDQPITRYGLDSLLVIELMHSLECALGVNLPVTVFFQSLTIAQLSGLLLEQLSAAASEPTEAFRSHDQAVKEYRLSHGQQALWFLQQIEPDSSAYNTASAVRVRSSLDVSALRRAFQILVDRHPALRTSFTTADQEPIQRIHSTIEMPFQHVDASAWSEADLRQRLAEHAFSPFDLERDSALRIEVFTRSDQEHVILLAAHHIIVDFWSLAVLAQEVGVLYSAEKAGTQVQLPPLQSEYSDYVEWQAEMLNGPEGELHWAYWQKQLGGELPSLDLPADRPRPPAQTFRGASQTIKLSAKLTDKLKSLSKAEDATLYMSLVAAFQVLLHRYTGQEDILIGSPTAGRVWRRHAGVIGYFVNPVVLRSDLSGAPTFKAFLAQVRQTALNALEHQSYPFSMLVERLQPSRDPSKSPIFQVMFALQKAPSINAEQFSAFALGEEGAQIQLGELKLESMALEQRVAQFDLVLNMAEMGGGLAASFQYNTDLFDASTIERMTKHLQILLEAIAVNATCRVSELPLLTSAESQHLLVECNDTRKQYRQDQCIHELIEAQAERSPNSVALIFEEKKLTYGELNTRANQLARYLMALGVGPEMIVGISINRSVEMLVGLLGVLKAGGAYVPLDPDFPQERLRFMMEDSHVPVLLTQQKFLDNFRGCDAQVISLDSDWEAISRQADQNPESKATPDNLAYVIYTSGSTGRPKGVMLTHRNVANFFTAMDERVGAESPGSWLAVTSISFDISVLELFWTLARGFQVVIEGEQDQRAYSIESMVNKTTDKGMAFSLFYFACDQGDAGEDKYRLLIEGAKFADRHAFTAVWTPERHFHEFGGLYPNPSVTSAAIAAVTETIQIRAGSVVLPLHNPVRVAEEWSVVDNLSKGRVGVSFASGWHANDFVLAPENYARRKEMMFEQLEIVRKLWSGESVNLMGGAGNEVEVKILPRPVQAELPIWITAAGSPETFEMAGAVGANLLTHLLGQSIEELTEKIALYRKSWKAHGNATGEGHVTLMLHAFVGEDMDAVRETVRKPFTNYLKTSFGLIKNLALSLGKDIESKNFTDDDLDAILSHAFDRYFETSGLMGTPGACLEVVDRLKAIGVDEVACLIDFGVDFDSVMHSLKLLDYVREQSNEKKDEGGEDYSIAAQMRRHKVSHLQCTPSLASRLSMEPESLDAMRGLSKLMLGGEPLPAQLIEKLGRELSCEILNMYGPTETTVWSATGVVDRLASKISIGRPIANTEIYILDKHTQPLPVGVPGELYIGGDGVGRGYLNRPDLSAEKFIPNPFAHSAGGRMYRTGDLACFRPDGKIEFLNRIDNQVKIRGHRIELGEIEFALSKHSAVVESAVTARSDAQGNNQLVAYVVCQGEAEPNSGELRAFLKERLPDYMVPSIFVHLDALPLTPNGKVDRRALPAPERSRYDSTKEPVAPRNPVEEVLAMTWAELLGLEKVCIYDNFFDLGGHSLLASQLVSRLGETFQIELSLRTFFQSPTVADLAEAMLSDPEDRARVESIAAILITVAQSSEDDLEPLIEVDASL